MVYITHIRLSGGTSIQHIERVRWFDPAANKSDHCSRQDMVDWIEQKKGDARVKGPYGDVAVTVVRAVPPYLKTKPNNTHEDNLLSLPSF
ncbi:DUF3892 domain-containing protein [Corallococcus caeni]|uniref:DUF3892 domain-containing protein n=1 Tax=Corallococcus caeni TaxID=3082388 RepID=A0ABQ6R4U8_9BACT|nr:hypothetical protein ASNO1_75970 [Corallococcus sp. NO1]